MDRIRERFFRSADDQLVQLPQKRRQGLPGSGRSEYERVGSARDRRPTLALRIARLAERLLEPSPYDGMKARQHGGTTSHVTGWGWGWGWWTILDCVLEYASQLLRPPFENLSREGTLSELVELYLLGPFYVIHENRVHLCSDAAVERYQE